MNLHNNHPLFNQTVLATAAFLKIPYAFIEKDYWITLVLNRLSNSQYFSDTVFKGGTSLSKGYNLIDRFSEDVDIAILDCNGKTGNETKNLIRSIEKEITSELFQIELKGVTSKGSRFRKTVFEYPSIKPENNNNKLIVEINSFANPFPFAPLIVQSFVYDFLLQAQFNREIELYKLEPFLVNILSQNQTLLEKLVALIRCSFDENPVESISGKIRHFYDLYFLVNCPSGVQFITSELFKTQFFALLDHDKSIFEEPIGWQSKTFKESPLIERFETLWNNLKIKYRSELSTLAYREIPDEKDIADNFIRLIENLK